MRIRYQPAFRRDLRRIRDPLILSRVHRKISEIEAAASIRDISNVSRMNTPGGNNYRVRIGNYRIGVTLEGDTVVLRRLLPRNEIYRRFP